MVSKEQIKVSVEKMWRRVQFFLKHTKQIILKGISADKQILKGLGSMDIKVQRAGLWFQERTRTHYSYTLCARVCVCASAHRVRGHRCE